MEVKRAPILVPTETTYDSARVYVHPGHLHITDRSVAVTTVVGSCVAVCLWDRDIGWAGMNHFVLPAVIGGAPSLRHGDVAMRTLLERLLGHGATPKTLRARIFGGACVIEAFRASGNDLGSRNLEVARRALQQHRIVVVQEDVGGGTGRKIVFNTEDGSAVVKPLP